MSTPPEPTPDETQAAPPEPEPEPPAEGPPAPDTPAPPAFVVADGQPVFVLAFANDRYGPTTGYLRDLVAEQRAIEKALIPAAVHFVARSNVTRDDLYDTLARHNDRIVGFHYGGHATESVLMLEDDAGRPSAARIEGLAGRLAQLPRLSLVVLNGCSTSAQVDVLREKCSAPVIATDQAIVDAVARDFAQRFYADLAADRSIGEAFDSAVSAIEATVDSPEATHRSAEPSAAQTRMLRPAEHMTEGGWPWRLYAPPTRAESLTWRISHAVAPPPAPRWPLALAAAVIVAALAGWAWVATGDDCAASSELCNGRDDDCDGRVDEAAAMCGPSGLGQIWGAGRCVGGACVMGACPDGWHDLDGEYATGCEYRCTPSAEVCNAADDDCDGIADEGFDGCDAHCDGIDSDGDGRSDEGCAAVRCGPERGDGPAVPPCNGCPDGVEVPAGWVCIPPGEDALPQTWTHRDVMQRSTRTRSYWPPRGAREPITVPHPLLMRATEVTQAEWAAGAPGAGREVSPSRNRCTGGEGRCPVEQVSWFEAAAFANGAARAAGLPACYDDGALRRCLAINHCHAPNVCPTLHAEIAWCEGEGLDALRRSAAACTGVRLPTHGEWRYALRAGRDTRYVGGDTQRALFAAAWYGDRGKIWGQPVAGLAPNRWGIYDIQGNVTEWLHDAPTGVRGCSARTPRKLCPDSYLEPMRAFERPYTVGIRLVRPLPSAP